MFVAAIAVAIIAAVDTIAAVTVACGGVGVIGGGAIVAVVMVYGKCCHQCECDCCCCCCCHSSCCSILFLCVPLMCQSNSVDTLIALTLSYFSLLAKITTINTKSNKIWDTR